MVGRWHGSGCCKPDKLGGPAQEVWRSSGPRETISSLKHGGGGCEGVGCSQQRGIPRMLSFNLESALHTLSLSLSLYSVLGFIWPILAFLLSCGREAEEKQIPKAGWQNSSTFQARLSFCYSLLLHAICVSVQEERWTGGTWEAEQRMTLVRKTKEDAQQNWLGEEEGKEPNKAQKNAANGECPFCFYNILRVVTIVSMKTVITLCLGHESERVPFVKRIYSGSFSGT